MAQGSRTELRTEFVGMMFALAAAEIGIQAAELTRFNLWDKALIPYSLPAWFHLALAATIIALSWVGWSRSKASQNIDDAGEVSDTRFFVLLLDVVLVIFYFIIVKNVEIATRGEGDSRELIVLPSAHREALWAWVVLVGYFIWDLLTKVVAEKNDQHTRRQRFASYELFWQRAWVSAACAIAGGISFCLLRRVENWWSVLVADASLVMLFATFRELKAHATRALPSAEETAEMDSEKRRRMEEDRLRRLKRAKVWSGIFASLWLASAVYACCGWRPSWEPWRLRELRAQLAGRPQPAVAGGQLPATMPMTQPASRP
jgi:hypothetical protein